MKVDIGCGTRKREGFIGVDITDTADYQCDISVDRLPFEDGSVEHLFSSHCLEHIPPERLGHVFREFTRVCADDGLVELWHPHPLHRDAHIFDHKTFLSEENYYHICYRFPEHWDAILGSRWVLEEVRYNLQPDVIRDLDSHGVELDFAIQYYSDVIKELGVLIRVEKTGPRRDKNSFRRVICDGPRENRYRDLGAGPYTPRLRPHRWSSLPRRLAGRAARAIRVLWP